MARGRVAGPGGPRAQPDLASQPGAAHEDRGERGGRGGIDLGRRGAGEPGPRGGPPGHHRRGHEIGDDDHGRPCVLIAAGLGVRTEVFRAAFAGVTPARGRGPSGDEARRNKQALLKVLGPHGVTNERLDAVSDYYRFRPQDDEIWKHKDARAHAVVVDGKVTKVVVDDPGAGYTTPPTVTVPGVPPGDLVVTLHFGKDLKKNGSIKSIELKK